MARELRTPGRRIRSRGGHVYAARVRVVREVLQSGRDTYTVCVSAENSTWTASVAARVYRIWAPRFWSSLIAPGNALWRPRKYRHYPP
jgi:hypothetical protein